MESKKRANWGVAIPPSVAAAIFSRLPIANLPACRSVCKSWNRLILEYAATNSSTPKAMIDAFNDPHLGRYAPRFRNPKIHCFDLDTLSFVASSTLIGPSTEFIRIFNFCNGLIFLDNGGIEIGSQSPGIFNPMTHEFFSVPYHVHIYTSFFDGFGFSPKTKQFKLFLVPGPEPESESDYMKILRFGTNDNQWIEVSLPFPLHITSQGCYMDGVIYFLGRDDSNYNMTIYALDVDTESFEVVTVLHVGNRRPGRAFLQLFNGTIYAKLFIPESFQVQIWKMKAKDSWIKEFTVCGDFSHKSFRLLKVSDEKIFIQLNKDLFWLNKSAGPMFELSMVEMVNKIKTLNIPSHGRRSYNVCPCLIETLHFGSLPLLLAGDEVVKIP